MNRLVTKTDFGVGTLADLIVKDRFIKILEKLYEYEELEEQGLLIKLSCKVGDTVYWISPFRSGINQGKIEFLNINKFGFDLAIMWQEGVLIRRELETVFLTREEAEKALEGNK